MKTFFQLTSSSICLLAGLSVLSPSPAQAQRMVRAQWKSESGDLLMNVVNKWGRSCASGTAQATYEVKDGVRGLIYPDDCEDNSGLARFEDTEGNERCVGAMQTDRVQSDSIIAIDTTWIIKSAVPGFRCSTAGQTFKVRLFSVE